MEPSVEWVLLTKPRQLGLDLSWELEAVVVRVLLEPGARVEAQRLGWAGAELPALLVKRLARGAWLQVLSSYELACAELAQVQARVLAVPARVRAPLAWKDRRGRKEPAAVQRVLPMEPEQAELEIQRTRVAGHTASWNR